MQLVVDEEPLDLATQGVVAYRVAIHALLNCWRAVELRTGIEIAPLFPAKLIEQTINAGRAFIRVLDDFIALQVIPLCLYLGCS